MRPFALVLCVALIGAAGPLSAQDYTTGSDSAWPDVYKIEEPPPQTSGVESGSDGARRDGGASRRPTGASSQSGTRESASPSAAPDADQESQTGNSPRQDSRPPRRIEAGDGGPPPLPERRGAETVAGGASLPQTLASTQDDGKLGEIAGQMILVGFEGKMPDEEWPARIAGEIEAGKIGGVFFSERNIGSPDQIQSLTAAFAKRKPALQAFLAVQQEGGATHSLPADRGFAAFPAASELGKSNDPLSAYGIYQRMAQDLVSYGFNMNLAPLADLQRDGNAEADNSRSFGAQPKHVAAFAKAFKLAHYDMGVFTVLKSFPGPVVPAGESGGGLQPAWSADSLEPYGQIIAAGNADIVMIGHGSHPDFSGEPGLPASLSTHAIQDILRARLGFTGVVISGDLEQLAAGQDASPQDIAVRAAAAGNDIVFFSNRQRPDPSLPEKIAAAFREAVADGRLSREKLEASSERIKALKQRLGGGGKAIASAQQKPQDN